MNSTVDNHDDGSELQAVMGAYFDALLQESSPVGKDASPPAAAEVFPNPVANQSAVEPHSVAVPHAAEHGGAEDQQAVSVSDIQSDGLSALSGCVAVPMAGQISVKPSATQNIAAPAYQLIQVGGLTLGVPTSAIADIIPLPITATPGVDVPAWLLGKVALAQGAVNIVDTAALLMPNTGLRITSQSGSLIVLRGADWALACDAIGAVLTPEPGQVHWRGAEGKRLWLAGTLRSPNCALLDIPRIINIISV